MGQACLRMVVNTGTGMEHRVARLATEVHRSLEGQVSRTIVCIDMCTDMRVGAHMDMRMGMSWYVHIEWV